MIWLPILLPLGFAALAPFPGRLGAFVQRLLPLASLPALGAALVPPAPASSSWLVLGMRLEVDPLGRALLLLVGLAWTAAAWFARDRLARSRTRFALFWCFALAGLAQSALAADLVGFYLGYAVMTVASYGLVVHEGSDEAVRAGRVYIVMAFLGEALVLSGLLLLGAHYGNVGFDVLPAMLAEMPAPGAGGLLLAGFAVKMGIVPLHVWLAVAHPVAPVPASAVLSGVIVKAGALGAARLVPGEAFGTHLPVVPLLAVGLFTAFYGVAAGLCQSRPKSVLAYSTVSQMGLLFCGLALALQGGPVRTLLPLWMLHHGLVKSALFLAVGCSPAATGARRVVLGALALSLAAAPFTGGMLAKIALKKGMTAAGVPDPFVVLLSLSSAATALLMLHLWRVIDREDESRRPVHPAWPLSAVVALVLPWTTAGGREAASLAGASTVWDGTWPLLLAGVAYFGWRRIGSTGWTLPEGDLLIPVTKVLRTASASLRRWPGWPGRPPPGGDLPARLRPLVERAERTLSALPTAGLLVLALVLWLRWQLR